MAHRKAPKRKPLKRSRRVTPVRRQYARKFDSRYGENWNPNFLAHCHSLTRGKCCYCIRRRSNQVHHVRYARNGKPIAGREVPGVDVFPVCSRCHAELHNDTNWIKSVANPVLGNRNTAESIQRLTDGFNKLCSAAVR